MKFMSYLLIDSTIHNCTTHAEWVEVSLNYIVSFVMIRACDRSTVHCYSTYSTLVQYNMKAVQYNSTVHTEL